ncbi:MAG: permease prefix domain 2-containing transporter [Dyadobacter sp.]|uniref:permease prefix domain 2-containing transporter n=1 Tax=Dyadobacter sp. TaxID=1914288 RepID=UPI003267409E
MKHSDPGAFDPLPPRWLDKLALKICAPHLREELIGDLHERYALRNRKFGPVKAKLFYLREVAALLRPSVIKRKSSEYSYIPLFSYYMIRNYFKIGSRVLYKNKGYSFIHLTGLSIGLWACMMVATVVIDSLSYDRQWSHANDIYRIISVNKAGAGLQERISSSPMLLAPELVNSYPEAVASTEFSIATRHFKFKNDDFNGVTTEVLRADTSVWGMIDLKVLAGNPRKFTPGTNNLLISRSFANRFFPGKDPVGKIIQDIPKYGTKANDYQITGLIDDLPYNSHLRADVVQLHINKPEPYEAGGFVTFSQNYIRMKPGTDMQEFTAKVNKWHQEFSKRDNEHAFEFQALPDIYLHSDFAEGQNIRGDARTIYIFSGIALLLLFIACVNFVNLSTAKAFARLKEAGVRRILSGSRYQLIIQLLTETLLLFGTAILVATFLYFFSLEYVEQFLGHRLIETFTSNVPMAVDALVIVFLTALLTGLYPAWLISGFKPSNTLRGVFTSSASYRQNWLRKGLVVVQFSISIVVLLATIVVWQQLNLMENKDLGYNTNNLLAIDNVSWDGKGDAFKGELLQIPGVVRASATLWLPTQGGGYMTREVEDPTRPEHRIKVWYIAGDVDLPATMGLKLIKGRMFSHQFSSDALNADSLQEESFEKFEQAAMLQSSLITASAAKALGVQKLDERIKNANSVPVGIIENFNNESLYEPIKPTVILAQRSPQYAGMLVRVQHGTERRVEAAIGRLWQQFYPAKLLEVNQIDDMLAKQYESETRLHQLFMFFSGLTMFLSVLGIFGLVVQAAEQRTKEVGIRKVLGASIMGIVTMLSCDFVRLVVIAIVIASPLAWFGLDKWLQNYPYRTDISWWMYAATGSVVLTITVLTVSFQAVRAALVDPVKSLRSE